MFDGEDVRATWKRYGTDMEALLMLIRQIICSNKKMHSVQINYMSKILIKIVIINIYIAPFFELVDRQHLLMTFRKSEEFASYSVSCVPCMTVCDNL